MKLLLYLFLFFLTFESFSQYCWEAQTSQTSDGVRAIHFAPNGNSNGIFATSAGDIGKTTDGGETWELTASFPVLHGNSSTILMMAVHMVDSQTCFAASFAGQVYKSTNGGESWVLNYETDQFNSYLYRIRESNGRLFLPSLTKLFFSDDYGNSWDSLSTFSGSIADISFKENLGILIDYPDKLFVTSDLGSNWTQLGGLPQQEGMISVFMIDSATFITVGEAGEIYGTTNAGVSWTNINSGTSETLENVAFGNNTNGLISGANGTLLSSSNGIFGPWSNSTNSGSSSATILGLHVHTGTYAWFGNEAAEIFKAPCVPEIINILDLIGPDSLCLSETFDYTIQYEVTQGVAENPAFKVALNGEDITGGFIEHTGVFNVGIHNLALNSTINISSGGTFDYEVTVVPNLNDLSTPLDVYGQSEPEFTIVYDCLLLPDTLVNSLSSFAFSPNNDGVNDYFILDFLEGTTNTLNIYNRWGDILVKYINYDNTTVVWNGEYNNKIVATGTYYFTVEYDQGNQQSGWIQVVK